MGYEEFLKELDEIIGNNYKILEHGNKLCSTCFDFHIELRELFGSTRRMLSQNHMSRDEDERVMDYFSAHQAIIVIEREEKGMCSHLIEMIDLPRMKKSDVFIHAKKLIVLRDKTHKRR